MAVKCKNCGGAHPVWECKKPKTERITVAVQRPDGGLVVHSAVQVKRKRGRPKTITDMRAYKAEHERKRRATKKKEAAK